MAEEQKPSRRTILSEYKTRLIGRPVDGASKSPTLAFSINDRNDITIKIYTNIEGDKNNGLIDGKGDIGVLFMITALIRAAVASKGPFSRTIKHEDHVFMRGSRSDNPLWKFDLCVRKDAGDADVRMIVKSYKRDDLEFYFRPSDFHNVVDGQGQALDVTTLSDGYAIGYCEMLEELAGDLLKDYQVRLYTTTEQRTVDNKPPSLVFGSIANNPRATVFTNVESDQHQNRGMIPAKIDTPIFYYFCELVGQAVVAPPGWRMGIKNYGYPDRQANGQRGEKVHESTLTVGKDEQGAIYVAVLSSDRNRPNLQFYLTTHRRFSVLDDAGNVLPLSKSTALMAMVYKKVFSKAIAKHLNEHYTPPDPSTWQNNGGGNRGGWSRGGQQQGQNQNRGNWNNNGGGQSGSGGNPNAEITPPAVPARSAAPEVFDDIPF